MFFKMPWFTRGMLERMADFLNPFEQVGGVIGINTLANGLRLDPNGDPYITPYGGLAGVGGAAIRDLALGQCMMWRNCLNPDKAVIGVGGIQLPKHVTDFLQYCDAVKVHTIYKEKRSRVFRELAGDVAA